MPTLIRFVLLLGGLAALGFAGLYLLANMVRIAPHEITETIELPRPSK